MVSDVKFHCNDLTSKIVWKVNIRQLSTTICWPPNWNFVVSRLTKLGKSLIENVWARTDFEFQFLQEIPAQCYGTHLYELWLKLLKLTNIQSYNNGFTTSLQRKGINKHRINVDLFARIPGHHYGTNIHALWLKLLKLPNVYSYYNGFITLFKIKRMDKRWFISRNPTH